jgi:hypothetical protein
MKSQLKVVEHGSSSFDFSNLQLYKVYNESKHYIANSRMNLYIKFPIASISSVIIDQSL